MSIAKGTRMGGIYSIDDLRMRCEVDDDTGCWLWLGGKTMGKPGVNLVIDGKRCCLPGRRAAAVLAGRRLSTQIAVWQSPKCHEAMCVSPDHAASGSWSQACMAAEKRDGWKRQAARVRNGIIRGMAKAKVTPAQVIEIRASTDLLRVVAERYGISRSQAGNIRSGNSWKSRAIPGSSVFNFAEAA